jgi:hypothetical protein
MREGTAKRVRTSRSNVLPPVSKKRLALLRCRFGLAQMRNSQRPLAASARKLKDAVKRRRNARRRSVQNLNSVQKRNSVQQFNLSVQKLSPNVRKLSRSVRKLSPSVRKRSGCPQKSVSRANRRGKTPRRRKKARKRRPRNSADKAKSLNGPGVSPGPFRVLAKRGGVGAEHRKIVKIPGFHPGTRDAIFV